MPLAWLDCGFIERRTNAAREFLRIVIGPEMNEEHPGLLVEHMAVDCRHLDVAGAKRADQRSDLVTRHQEIACDRRFAISSGLKIDGIGAPERAGDLHSALHAGLAPRHAELIDAADSVALDLHDLVELRGIEINRRRRAG